MNISLVKKFLVIGASSGVGAWFLCLCILTACSLNFEFTSQRTALENQVMGSYKELDDDLVLISSVRGLSAEKTEPTARQKKAIDARQNQEFNRDDIDEFKTLEVIGETNQGTLALLPEKIGKALTLAKQRQQLAQQLVEEENADRLIIWRRVIDNNPNLATKDLPQVQKMYANMQRDQMPPGQWYQDESGGWQKKSGTVATNINAP